MTGVCDGKVRVSWRVSHAANSIPLFCTGRLGFARVTLCIPGIGVLQYM